jgi:S-adenosylmethionine/arginine decarboxylase-like enzyme
MLGDHYIVELYLCNPKMISNETLLRGIIVRPPTRSRRLIATCLPVCAEHECYARQTDSIIHGNGTLMSILSHGFHPGVTVLALLAESHVAIHTWCEDGGGAGAVHTVAC